MNKKNIVDSFFNQTSSLKTIDKIEILANIFIRMGIEDLNLDTDQKNINPSELLKLVIQNKNDHGDSIYNSVIRQGLLMLSWIEEIKEENNEKVSGNIPYL